MKKILKKLRAKENLQIPLVHFTDKEDFDLYWPVKPVPSCRIYDFENLLSGGIDVMRLTKIQRDESNHIP
ncbi:hypothetical protein A2U01_0033232 [Trifolium medium]|uniref:Uncharacterized protein n=1 Tax=Trifolium medium TaxID=97028 RepID=A0A392PKU8_9FABA|nr:hypothetical protein [Trifolium medium]